MLSVLNTHKCIDLKKIFNFIYDYLPSKQILGKGVQDY